MKKAFLYLTVFAATLAFANRSSAEVGIVDISENTIQPAGVFTVLTYDSPKEIKLADTGLKEAGLTSGGMILKSDEIRIFENKSAQNESPLARIWLNAGEDGAYWFQTGGEGDAADFVIPKGAMVVVWTRASAEPIMWTNVFE